MKRGHFFLRWSIFVLPALVLLSGCENTDPVLEETPPPQVRFLTVQPQRLYTEVVVTGTVVSQEIARVHPDVTGCLLDVRVREGDMVHQGDTLAELDPEPFRLNAQIAEAELLRAKSQIDRVLRGYRPEEIEVARSLYENAKAVYRSRAENLERNRTLYRSGAMTEKDWVVFRAELEASKAMVEKASAELTKMLQGYEEYDIQSASAAVSLAKAKRALALRDLNHTRIRAPIDGVVTSRRAEIGQLVTNPNELFVIQNPEKVWLVVDVGLRNATRIRPGQEVDFITEMGSGKGFVDRLGHFFQEQTRTMRAWLAWNPDSETPPVGAFAKAVIHVDPVPDTIILRREWVHLEDGEHFVWLLKENRLHKRSVVLGEDHGDEVSIASGISPGEKVVVSPPSSFEEGMEVKTREYIPESSPQSEDILSISMTNQETQ